VTTVNRQLARNLRRALRKRGHERACSWRTRELPSAAIHSYLSAEPTHERECLCSDTMPDCPLAKVPTAIVIRDDITQSNRAHLQGRHVVDVQLDQLQGVAVALLQLRQARRLLRAPRRHHNGIAGCQDLCSITRMLFLMTSA